MGQLKESIVGPRKLPLISKMKPGISDLKVQCRAILSIRKCNGDIGIIF